MIARERRETSPDKPGPELLTVRELIRFERVSDVVTYMFDSSNDQQEREDFRAAPMGSSRQDKDKVSTQQLPLRTMRPDV